MRHITVCREPSKKGAHGGNMVSPVKRAPAKPAQSGEGGIRTLEARIHAPNALAGRRLQPLGHFSEAGTG
jgi:hypothetical protein